MGLPLSSVRKRPTESKFSKAKPTGSRKAWQPAQEAFSR